MDAVVWIMMSEDVMSRSQASWRRGEEALALCAALSQAVCTKSSSSSR